MKDFRKFWRAPDGTWLEMRPMRNTDAPLVKQSLNQLSASSRRNRFFASIAEFSDDAVERLVVISPQREYLLVVVRHEAGLEVPIGGGRFVQDEQGSGCSFSLLIGDAWQGQRIGRKILKALLREASRRGVRQMHGDVLSDNRPMLALARSLRFSIIDSDPREGTVQIVRDLPIGRRIGWRRWLRRLMSG